MAGSRPDPHMFASVAESARRFVHEYVREWQPTDERSVERLAEALKRLQAGVNGYDVSVFVKPGGLCPFCNMTLALLRRELSAREFSLHEADLLHDEREALKVMVKDQVRPWHLTPCPCPPSPSRSQHPVPPSLRPRQTSLGF